ncbi:MAG TPA: type II toxin-antitoxin system RelE/ParE family toxin [Phycisphaerales bacterium]|nr:type II toxin-antitoxin system RelE/ParE family toxin [Phycisphaerales bacterium]
MIHISDCATSSLDNIADFLALQGGTPLGEHFLTCAFDTFDELERQPRVGTPHDTPRKAIMNLRRWPVHEFPNHLVFYREVRGGIEIIDIIHAARDLPRVLGG